MTMKWRARFGMLVVMGLAVVALATPALNRPWHISKAVAVLVAVGILGVSYALPFLVFRCPHCRARQIRFRFDWLSIGDRCWQCHQPLDGPAIPLEVLDEELVAEVNPPLAAAMRQDRLVLDDLRGRAPTDPAAAARLERELSTQVERLRGWVALVEREAPSEEPAARRELAQAEAQLAQCRAPRAHNA